MKYLIIASMMLLLLTGGCTENEDPASLGTAILNTLKDDDFDSFAGLTLASADINPLHNRLKSSMDYRALSQDDRDMLNLAVYRLEDSLAVQAPDVRDGSATSFSMIRRKGSDVLGIDWQTAELAATETSLPYHRYQLTGYNICNLILKDRSTEYALETPGVILTEDGWKLAGYALRLTRRKREVAVVRDSTGL